MPPCGPQSTVRFHPRLQRRQLRDYCRQEGIFFQAYSSMARQSITLIDDPVVQRLAKAHDATPQTILLSYGVSKGVAVIPKSQEPEHLREDYQCLFRLSYREMEELDSIEESGRVSADGLASEDGSEGDR